MVLLKLTTLIPNYDLMKSRCLYKELRGHKNTWFEAELFPKLILIDMNKNKIISTKKLCQATEGKVL